MGENMYIALKGQGRSNRPLTNIRSKPLHKPRRNLKTA